MTGRLVRIFTTFLFLLGPWAALPLEAQSGINRVSALGRLEPEHGVARIGAPSLPQAISWSVLASLEVEEGEDVKKGQLLGVLDAASVLETAVAESEAELELAKHRAEAAKSRAEAACVEANVAMREADRRGQLFDGGVIGEEERDSAQGDAESLAATCASARTEATVAVSSVALAEAQLARHRAELRRARIYAPFSGRVLDVHARPGELVTPEGILELGNVDRMYAIAEVFETEIGRVEVGQRAQVTSNALPRALGGQVVKIRHKVMKQDELGTDPAARKDARIVEVEILLDDSEPAANLTNLQVDVVIETGGRSG
jgi:HlyD family secretion protein